MKGTEIEEVPTFELVKIKRLQGKMLRLFGKLIRELCEGFLLKLILATKLGELVWLVIDVMMLMLVLL